MDDLGPFLLAALALTTPAMGAAPRCAPAGELRRVPELVEGSGVAASHRVPGRLWAHNDSGEPVLFALSQDGSVTGRVRRGVLRGVVCSRSSRARAASFTGTSRSSYPTT